MKFSPVSQLAVKVVFVKLVGENNFGEQCQGSQGRGDLHIVDDDGSIIMELHKTVVVCRKVE